MSNIFQGWSFVVFLLWWVIARLPKITLIVSFTDGNSNHPAQTFTPIVEVLGHDLTQTSRHPFQLNGRLSIKTEQIHEYANWKQLAEALGHSTDAYYIAYFLKTKQLSIYPN